MDTTMNEARLERDGQGRFAPGQSGNPAGKKPGTPNRTTRLRDLLAEGDFEAAVRALMDLVHDGNAMAVRMVIERVFPRPRDREIHLGLPSEGATMTDLVDRMLSKVAAGEITLDEASRMARLIELQRRVAATPAVASAEPTAAPDAGPSDEAVSPASDLQTAGDGASVPSAPAAAPRPLNRHERRREAALERAARTAPFRAAA